MGARNLISTQATSYVAAVYSTAERYHSKKLFLHAECVATHFDALAKLGVRYDARGKHSDTCHLFLIDERTDFTRDFKKIVGSRHIGTLKTKYCVLVLQPFVEALATFEGDPLSDEALEWRKQFTVLVPYVAPPGLASRPGHFMVRPDLKEASERKEAERRAAFRAARKAPLPPAGEDGF